MCFTNVEYIEKSLFILRRIAKTNPYVYSSYSLIYLELLSRFSFIFNWVVFIEFRDRIFYNYNYFSNYIVIQLLINVIFTYFFVLNLLLLMIFMFVKITRWGFYKKKSKNRISLNGKCLRFDLLNNDKLFYYCIIVIHRGLIYIIFYLELWLVTDFIY